MSKHALALRIVDSDPTHAPGLVVGEIVRTGTNRFPQYKVVAINGKRAWIRDLQYGDDHVVAIASIHRI